MKGEKVHADICVSVCEKFSVEFEIFLNSHIDSKIVTLAVCSHLQGVQMVHEVTPHLDYENNIFQLSYDRFESLMTDT